MAISKKKKFAVAGGIGALIITGGAAFAFWTSTGTASTDATVGDEGAWTVTIDSATVANGLLTPGGDTDNIEFNIANDESGAKQITAVNVSVVTDVATCLAADFDITNVTNLAGADVAAGSSVDGSFDVTMLNSSINQDDCKGATLTYTVNVS